jgi:Matrixin
VVSGGWGGTGFAIVEGMKDSRLALIRWGFAISLFAVVFASVELWHPAPQESCNFVQNTEAQRVSWKGDLPVHLHVHKSMPAEAYASLQAAIEDFHQTLGKQMFVVDEWGADGPDEPQKDNKSTIYWMTHWESNRAKEQARTTLYWNGDQIYEADIRINAANFGFIYRSRGLSSTIDLESLLVHELGHVLGLKHDSTHGSVMNISLNDGQLRRHLGSTNLSSLRCEY